MATPVSLRLRNIRGRIEGPHLLITAGVHGDEFEGMAAIRKVAQQLDPAVLRGQVTLVPVVNESAFLRGQRTAEDNLDLARHCPGRLDGSITEQIAYALSALIRAADYYIDLHSGGVAMCITPLTGYMLHADSRVLEQQRRMARAFNLPLVWGTSPALHGRSLSVARDAGVPAIYAEYLGSGVCSQRGVEDYMQGLLNVMSKLGMIEHPSPPNRVERIVEDSRPESGHLQICHPSPAAGFFEPVVHLGQDIQQGDLLGNVIDFIGAEICDVFAETSGQVISLATFASVPKGRGLAVVLEEQGAMACA